MQTNNRFISADFKIRYIIFGYNYKLPDHFYSNANAYL
jgi:hypothetical protein